jgi:hypothetical protein
MWDVDVDVDVDADFSRRDSISWHASNVNSFADVHVPVINQLAQVLIPLRLQPQTQIPRTKYSSYLINRLLLTLTTSTSRKPPLHTSLARH